MDKIIIKGLTVFAYHGVNPEEKENGQIFILDITAFANLTKAGETDCLDDTVSYAKIAKAAVAVFTAEKYDLLEKAARVTALEILKRFDKLDRVTVLLKKPDAPVKLDFEYMGVEITCDRSDISE